MHVKIVPFSRGTWTIKVSAVNKSRARGAKKIWQFFYKKVMFRQFCHKRTKYIEKAEHFEKKPRKSQKSQTKITKPNRFQKAKF